MALLCLVRPSADISVPQTDTSAFLKTNTVVTIPKGTTRVELRILRGGVTAGSVSGNLKIQLELGNTAHEWMKPDVTSLEGAMS